MRARPKPVAKVGKRKAMQRTKHARPAVKTGNIHKPIIFKAPLVIGNWKLNPATQAQATSLASAILKQSSFFLSTVRVGITPSVLHVQKVVSLISGRAKAVSSTGLFCGVQDVSVETSGAHTGAVSAIQAQDIGVQYAIVGHSEVRAKGDTNAVVNKKILTALSAGLAVVVCIGESARDEEGVHFSVIDQQIDECFRNISPADADRVCIAYEPVWAIGTGVSIAPTDLHEMILYIRKRIASAMWSRHLAHVPILYGGSVDPANAGQIIETGEANGFLVGGSSLNADSFLTIIGAVKQFAAKAKRT